MFFIVYTIDLIVSFRIINCIRYKKTIFYNTRLFSSRLVNLVGKILERMFFFYYANRQLYYLKQKSIQKCHFDKKMIYTLL